MNNFETLVLITGAFDPLHSGHLDMFDEAAQLGKLYIGLNSDDRVRSKRQLLFPFLERFRILQSLKQVHEVFGFDDSDSTSGNAIKLLRNKFVENKIIFANGGIRQPHNTAESKLCKEYEVDEVYGLGGNNVKYQADEMIKKYIIQFNSQPNRVTL